MILPERNGKDLGELPDEVKKTMEIVLVKKVAETMAAALETEVVLPLVPPGDAATEIEPQIHA